MRRFPIPMKVVPSTETLLEDKVEWTTTIKWNELDEDEISVVMSAIAYSRPISFEVSDIGINELYDLVVKIWQEYFDKNFNGYGIFQESEILLEYWQYLLTMPLTPGESIIQKRANLIQGII